MSCISLLFIEGTKLCEKHSGGSGEIHMIFLMMTDASEDKRKFVILYEKYRYLITITRNAAVDIYRKKKARLHRDIFLLKYSSCLENSEIAGLCGIQEGTVRQRISRGKKMIEEALEKREKDEHGKDKRNG